MSLRRRSISLRLCTPTCLRCASRAKIVINEKRSSNGVDAWACGALHREVEDTGQEEGASYHTAFARVKVCGG
jgi:hypothetical protein